jgi:tetratricopeptide (TPR) repeat protein
MKSLFVAALALAASLGVAQVPLKELKKLEKNYAAAKGALAKKPKDKKVRDTFVTAGVKYGHESMMSPDLSAKVKYRQALRIYREVLKVDPTNPVARKETDLIVSIYKQMGRPIPK